MAQSSAPDERPRIAVLANIYKTHLHTQHIIDRVLDGYNYGAEFQKPALHVISIYVEQRGEGDLVPERAHRHNIRICNSVDEALTLGTDKLAVDGVIYIGEQGDYPRNELGLIPYPRYQFFQKVVETFRRTGKVVPYYTDKHLSWNWDWAREMYDTSKKMGFPMMGGSSLPVTWRIPQVEMPDNAVVKEAMCVAFGGLDSYDIHALETVQCMVERRKGGETGVEWVQAYRGDNFWKAHEQGVWSQEVFKAAACRSHTLAPGRDNFTDSFPTVEEMKPLIRDRDPVAYHYRYKDGLRGTIMLLNGFVEDFNFAAQLEGRDKPFSTMMYLSRGRERATLESYFDPLVHYIERFMITKKEQYPIERVLLANGILCAGLASLRSNQAKLPTPQLNIAYQPAASTLRRT
ncbi:MAG TPA: hypothetical protein VG714_01275 [Acidobacteriaceae bacterium]|nr:hypothetical protein [Acidobacteriaceae bacterium]